MKYTLPIAILSLIVLSSCSDYNEVLKSDDYSRKLEVANDMFERGSTPKIKHAGKKNEKRNVKKSVILRSVSLYEQVYQRLPKTAEGELSYFRIGKAYYVAQDYYMAGYYLGMFPQRFPYSIKAEESLFLSAMCSVHNSPEASLDQTETELAINDLQQFIDRYPRSEYVDSCNNIIDGLRYKIEQKAFESVQLYSKTERFRAAVSSALTFADDFPMSEHQEEVSYILVKNSYLLAKNSVESKKVERINETFERYDNFVVQFPESKYIKELAGYVDSARGELEEVKKITSK
jgi:outer membrane protein assembly factor BamD